MARAGTPRLPFWLIADLLSKNRVSVNPRSYENSHVKVFESMKGAEEIKAVSLVIYTTAPCGKESRAASVLCEALHH